MTAPILSPSLDLLALQNNWALLTAADPTPPSVHENGFVVGAVPWSSWDGDAVKSLATYLANVPSPTVAIFNIDDTDGRTISERLPGTDVQPYAVPVIVRYLDRRPVRVEQGMPAVKWMHELAERPAI